VEIASGWRDSIDIETAFPSPDPGTLAIPERITQLFCRMTRARGDGIAPTAWRRYGGGNGRILNEALALQAALEKKLRRELDQSPS